MDSYNKASSSNENRVMKLDEDWDWKSNNNNNNNNNDTTPDVEAMKGQFSNSMNHNPTNLDVNLVHSVNTNATVNSNIKNNNVNVNNVTNNNCNIISGSSKPRRRIFRWPLICQVDGCGSDLSALKEYHQRYKICEHHLKVNHIIKNGEKHRFCQQCGRFHVLAEFDGVKRSCRTRLERHNRRRRIKEMAKKRRRVNTYPYNDVNIYKNDITMTGHHHHHHHHTNSKLPGSTCVIMSNHNLTANPNLVKNEIFNIQKEPYGAKCLEYNQSQQAQLNMRQQQQHEDEAIAEVFTHYAQSSEAYELWQALQSSKCNINHHHEKTRCQSLEYPSSSDIMSCGNVVNTSQGNVTPTSSTVTPVTSQMYYPRLGMNNNNNNNSSSSNGSLYPYNYMAGTEGMENSYGGSYGEGNSNIHMKCQPNGAAAAAAAGSAMMVGSAPNIYLGNVIPKVEDVQQDMETSHSSDDEQQKQKQTERPDALYDSLLKLTSLSVKVFNCTPANLPQSMRRELLGAVRNGLVPEEYMRPGLIDCDSIVLN